MSIDYRLAFIYPFKKENRLNCLLVPALITLIYTSLSALLDYVYTVYSFPKDFPPLLSAVFLKGNLKFLILQIFFAFLSGYNWHLTKTFQENGFDAAAPSWVGMLKTYWIDGLKLLLFFLIVFIPFYAFNYLSIGFLKAPNLAFAIIILVLGLLILLSYFFISPFLGTSYIKSAPSRRLRELFNFIKFYSITLSVYGKMLLIKLVFYILVVISVFLLLLSGLLPPAFRFLFIFLLGFVNSSIIMTIFSHILTQVIVTVKKTALPTS